MKLRRLTSKPILLVQTHPQAEGNINGPSLIRIPEWVSEPLGRYYLYFAHHNGKSIRLACADALQGPWTIYDHGVLPLLTSGFKGHIASPDVHVEEETQRIFMYFHGSDSETDASSPQFTRLAVSEDGLEFGLVSENLGRAYWRVFKHNGFVYSLEMPGRFKRSVSEFGPFENGPQVFDTRMRHSAVALRGNSLDVFFSNIGDCPECILHTAIDVSQDWSRWTTGTQTVVATPNGRLEGAECERVPSQIGIARHPVNELRDPAVFEDDGRRFLLFSVAGEQGISIAELE